MPARIIQIKVKPSSRTSLLEQNEDGTWLAQIKSPPVDGKANAAVIETIAAALGIPRGRVHIVRGETGRRKTLRLEGVSLAALLAAVDVTAR
jgi:uncharacterized protein (TIGR00251 family)